MYSVPSRVRCPQRSYWASMGGVCQSNVVVDQIGGPAKLGLAPQPFFSINLKLALSPFYSSPHPSPRLFDGYRAYHFVLPGASAELAWYSG